MKRHLVVIDPQWDFCKPDGALYVPGADDDMRRLASLVKRAGDRFDAIHVTLDSHQWIHIAHPIFWTNADGELPGPFTVISEEDVRVGVWQARDSTLRSYAQHYVEELRAKGRYQLTIWPPHCVVGALGHAVHDELGHALRGWSEATLKTIDFVPKGGNMKTEHYSAIRADVPDPLDPSTLVNRSLVDALSEADQLVFAGEALDYCLLNTLRDLIEIAPELIAKIVLIRDATSSIGVCNVDDHEFFVELADQGLRYSTTTEFLA